MPIHPTTLLQAARGQIRLRHLSLATEQSYTGWMRRYIRYCKPKHPRVCGAYEVEGFLTSLAVDQHVSASTQNQALQALLFLYRQVLSIDLPWLNEVVRAIRSTHVPVVLTQAETRRVLAGLSAVPALIARLLYGGGLRLTEALRRKYPNAPYSWADRLPPHLFRHLHNLPQLSLPRRVRRASSNAPARSTPLPASRPARARPDRQSRVASP